MRKFLASLACAVTFLGCTTIFLPQSANADSIGNGETAQDAILSVENAVLQNYTIEDLKATQDFLIARPYDGPGRVIDYDQDGIVDVFDLCLLKRNYHETGNYHVLLTELINSKGVENTTILSSGETYTNRVVVRAEHEYDFSQYKPIAILSDTEYKYILQFDSVDTTEKCLEDLQNKEGIVYAELDVVESLPDDECFDVETVSNYSLRASNSWGVSEIEADRYAEYLANNFNSHITVAVIDTGVKSVPFLSGRILGGGRDYVNGDNDPTDDQGHGTHVAGTIVDCTPNLNIDILPIKVLKPDWEYRKTSKQWVLNGVGNASQIAAGIDYAVAQGVDVINLSLGGPHSQQKDEAINKAIKSGITVVVAAGNENDNTYNHCPAHNSDAIVVSAVNSSLNRSSFSNYGQAVDVAAPGENIKSCVIDGIYDPNGNKYYTTEFESWNGTSMATPHISAAVAMIKYSGIAKSPSDVCSKLTSTCKDLGATGKDIYYGYGIPKLSKLITSSIKPSITLSSKSATLYTGQKYTLSASVTPGDVDVKWTTSNSTVATVNNGVVTANNEGSATITAFFAYNGSNYSATCNINVKNPGITLSDTSKTIYQTNTFSLKATTLPSNLTVFWSSSNSNVATVSNGNVTAVNPGTATITASFSYEGTTYSASCNVTVKEVSVKLDQTSKTVYQTDEFTLTATSTPTGQSISWSSSDSSIAKVSNGKVTAVNPGTAKITASFVYGGKTFSASCSVTVKKVSLELNAHERSVMIGETSSLTATTSPGGLNVTWESTNNMVASVDGGKIIAKAPGTIIITASMIYNGKIYSDKCSLTVVMPSVKMKYTQAKISRNETLKLLADTLPEDQKITWYSEDNSICSVDSSGVITGKSIGNTLVYASITYGGTTYTDKCNVIVGEPKVSLDKTSMSFYVGDSYSLVASVIAVDGSNISSETRSDISWSSSNNSVATVDSNGAVKAVAMGNATITAKYKFCGISYSATCSVVVQGKPEITLNKTSLSMYIGDSSTLTAKTTPSTVSVSWSSSDSSVAMVSNGKITAISNGTATITASFRYNGVNYSTTCKVTVIKPSISVSIGNSSIWIGDTAYVSKSGNIPSGVTVSWSSSNTNVATVNSNGTITGVGGGTATITGSFSYGGNKYSSNLTVKILTTNSVRTFFIYPSSAEDKHIIARGYSSSTVFTFDANVGFVADKVTIQVMSTEKQLQQNDTVYDYIAYSKEVNMTKTDVSHWHIETTLSGFSAGTYFVRCRAYNGSSSSTAYVRVIIL